MSVAAEIVTIAALTSIIEAALTAAGTSAANAASVAKALVAAEVDGQTGHGLSRVPSYVAQVKAGKVDGKAVPRAADVRPATIAIDAAYGFAYPALDLAIARLPEMARRNGIASAGINRSHHAGAVGLVVERLANQGLIAILAANTPSAMAPWGGRTPLLGTNPLAFAAPRPNAPPIVIDMALSEVARGRIVTAAQKGESIPQGWAIDADGQPTTDAKAALAGALLPAGGAKGAALALMIEVLSAAMTGAQFASEASPFLNAEGPPPATGQMLIAIDAGAFQSHAATVGRIGALAAMIEAEPGARLPGSRRQVQRDHAAREGLFVDSRLLADVKALGRAS